MKSRILLYVSIIQAMLIFVGIFGYASLLNAREAATDALYNARVCRQLCNEIMGMRRSSEGTDLGIESSNLSNEQVLSFLFDAGVAEKQVKSIAAVQTGKPADSDFLRKDTVVQLTSATIRQIVKFATTVEDRSNQTRVRQLEMTARKIGTEVGDQREYWDVRMVLTQTIATPS